MQPGWVRYESCAYSFALRSDPMPNLAHLSARSGIPQPVLAPMRLKKPPTFGGSGTQALRLTALQTDGVAEQNGLFPFVLDYSIRNVKRKINRRF